jgi:hypothetical protein
VICGTERITLSKRTTKETKQKFYDVLAVQVSYNSKTWGMRNKYERIESAEMKFIRQVKGHT